MRKVKEDLTSWREIPSSYIKRIIAVKMPIFSKSIPIKIPAGYFLDFFFLHVWRNWQMIPKCIWKCKGPKIIKITLKGDETCDNLLQDIRTYLKIQKMWQCDIKQGLVNRPMEHIKKPNKKLRYRQTHIELFILYVVSFLCSEERMVFPPNFRYKYWVSNSSR